MVSFFLFLSSRVTMLTSVSHQVNIRDMVKGKFSEFRRNTERGGTEGGVEGWKKIVVTLVFDGVVPADKEALE